MEELILIAAESRRELQPGTVTVCIDDRFSHVFKDGIPEDLQDVFITEEKDSGPQIPGGAAGIVAVLAQTAPDGVELNFDQLYGITALAHEKAGFKMGVHMDNHHDETTDEQIIGMVREVREGSDTTKLTGCGYAGMLEDASNPLQLSEKASTFFQESNIVARMVKKGANLVELEGHHASADKGEALAISNMQKGTTLDHEVLEKKGVKVYGHDPLVADEIINHAADILRKAGQTEWADNVSANGSEIERKHHRIAAVKLTGREPVEIN